MEPTPDRPARAAFRGGLSRRTALAALGGAGAAAFLAACGSSSGSDAASATSTTAKPSTTTTATGAGGDATTTTLAGACATLTKEQEQGPYYYPAAAVRSDITDGKPGVPMKLQLTVMDVQTCKPVTNATVDVWTADALGEYSDTSSGLFLRGLQSTDANGVATFTTIYPGWYPGRTNHVHVKVHIGGTASKTYSGGHVSHTGNLFFPENVSTTVAQISPYTDNTADRTTLTKDFVYNGQNGSGSIMTLRPVDPATPASGYTATMVLGIEPDATPAGIGIAGTVN